MIKILIGVTKRTKEPESWGWLSAQFKTVDYLQLGFPLEIFESYGIKVL